VESQKYLQANISQHIVQYRLNPKATVKLSADWRRFTAEAAPMSQQLTQKIQTVVSNIGNPDDTLDSYHPWFFRYLLETSKAIDTLMAEHGKVIAGAAPAATADQLDAALQARVATAEKVLGAVLLRNVFDPAGEETLTEHGAGAAPAGTPAPAAVPAAPASPAAAPAPAAPAAQ
jgi:hypothetical protein